MGRTMVERVVQQPAGELAERVGFEPTVLQRRTHALQARLIVHSSTSPRHLRSAVTATLAERVGFEPTLRLRTDRFSRAAP